MRRCSKCRLEKRKKEFWNDASRKDGLCPKCKICAARDNREYSKRYSFKKIQQRHRRVWPEKVKATRYLQYMISVGKVKKNRCCFLCGGKERVDGHHINYRFKAKVLWLCRQHHQRFHLDWRETRRRYAK